jgi:hypothetical protein
MPNFEVFDKRSVPISGEPMVTVQRKGPISLNLAAFHALGKPSHIELLYDPNERIMGFRALNEPLAHAYPVRQQGRSHTFLIAGHKFLKYYGIPNEVSIRYVAKLYDDVLGVDLKQKGLEVTSNRSGHTKTPDAPSG